MVYRFVEGRFPGGYPGQVLKKIALNTALLGCVGNWSLIFGKRMLAGATDHCAAADSPMGERISAVAQSVNDDWIEVMSYDLKIWPLVDLLVFTLVPVRLRVAFVSTVSTCWQTFLSYTASQGTASTAASIAPTESEALDSGAPVLRRTLSRPPAVADGGWRG